MVQNGARGFRLRHYQGQRLRGPDLQDEYDNLAWLRGMHTVALHNTWGIALGFEVSPDGDGVLVGPGMAYDCYGRELLLSHDEPLAGPRALFAAEIGSRWELVAIYDTERGRPAEVDPPIPCAGLGARAGAERPAFAWRRPGQVRLGLEVPLLAATVGAAGLGPFDLSVRQHLQPLARPHVAGGSTGPQQVWTVFGDAFGRVRFGLETRIDTSEAGFVGTPFYLASLQRTAGSSPVGSPAEALNLPYFFTSVVRTGPAGFTLQLILAAKADEGSMSSQRLQSFVQELEKSGRVIDVADDAGLLPWFVTWLGVEPVAGCEPISDFPTLTFQLALRRALPLGGFNLPGGLAFGPHGGIG